MKILFIADDFPPQSFGGAGIITCNLAKVIAESGHEVIVITAVQDKIKEGWTIFDKLKVYNIYTNYPDPLEAYISLYNYPVVRQMKKLLAEIKPDIIHLHNIHHYLSYGILAECCKYTSQVFLTTHDAMAFNHGKLIDYYDTDDLSVQKNFNYKVGIWRNMWLARPFGNPFRNFFIKRALNRYPKKVIAISHELEKALNQNGIKNTTTIHYGIQLENGEVPLSEKEQFRQQFNLQGKKVILFGGRLSDAKGGAVTLKALQKVVARDSSVILLIAGKSNAYTESLLNKAVEWGIKDSILITGWLSRQDMQKAYAAVDVVVTPSIYFDAFNLFNIEAGAAGKPVVGTCFGGTPEIIINNVTGKIVNPRNIDMFAEALISILEDKNLKTRLGEAGRKRVKEHFSMARFVAETLSVYTE